MTAKEADFVRHYVVTKSAKEAARLAGYSESQQKRASVILHRPHIAEAIKQQNKAVMQRIAKTDADVIQELSDIAFQDPVSFMKNIADEGEPANWVWKSPEELTKAQRACIRTVRVYQADPKNNRPERYQYSFHDKMSALNQMGRHFGIFDDKLKLIQSQSNPFKNATPEQLAQLKRSFVGIMSGEVVDGEYTEKTAHLLPNGKGRARSGR